MPRGSRLFLPLIVAALCAPGVLSAAPSDSMAMQLIARLPMYSSVYPCGDTDHDGKPEIWATRTHEGICVAEHAGGSSFDTTMLPILGAGAWYLGDADRDGLSDIVTGGDNWTRVWEARDSWSFPDTLVWEVYNYCGSGQHSMYIDLDCDSALEIATHDISPTKRRILRECTGDNSFTEVAAMGPDPRAQMYGQMAFCPDLDGDGLPEAVEGGQEWLFFHESPANDSPVCIAALELVESGGHVTGCAAAPDMDRNGKDEVVVTSRSRMQGTRIRIYEAFANDSFEVVWTDWVDGGTYGSQTTAVGDVDGDGVPEFGVSVAGWVIIYRATGPGEYEMMWRHGVERSGFNIYDVTGDGRAEIIYCGIYETLVWSWLEVGVEERERAALDAVQVRPSVVSRGGVVRLDGLADETSVVLLDASGRVVRVTSGSVVQTRGLSVGMYFLRMTAGRSVVLKKLLVVE